MWRSSPQKKGALCSLQERDVSPVHALVHSLYYLLNSTTLFPGGRLYCGLHEMVCSMRVHHSLEVCSGDLVEDLNFFVTKSSLRRLM